MFKSSFFSISEESAEESRESEGIEESKEVEELTESKGVEESAGILSSFIISETTSGLVSSSSSLCKLFPINTPIKHTTIDADITTTLSLFFNTFCKLCNIIYILCLLYFISFYL